MISIGYFRLKPQDYLFSKHLNISLLELEKVQFELIIDQGQDDLNLQYLIDYFQTSSKAVQTDSLPLPTYTVSIADLQIRDAMFRYWDQNNDYPNEAGMDYAHLKIENIRLSARSIRVFGDSITGTIEHLSCRDTCGLILSQFSGEATVSGTMMKARNLVIETPNSALKLDLDFQYNSYWDWIDFIDSVNVVAKVNESSLYMADLGYFSPLMFDMTNTVVFSGDAIGKVSDFSAQHFFVSTGKETYFSGDVRLSGLPDFYTTFMEVSLREFETSTEDINQFAIPGELRFVALPDFVKGLGKVHLQGNFIGYYDDFITNANIITGLGSAVADFEFHANQNEKDSWYKGKFLTQQFQLGHFIKDRNNIGRLDMNIQLDGKGLTSNSMNIDLSGSIGMIEVLDNTFNDIDLAGKLTGKNFNGSVNIRDNKLNLDFLGKVDFSGSLPFFNFRADVKNADLFGLHLFDNDSVMRLSTQIEVNFNGLKPNEIQGGVIIDNTRYTDSRDTYLMKHLKLITTNDTLYQRKLSIRSDFFDLELGGIADYTMLAESFKADVTHYVQFGIFKPN